MKFLQDYPRSPPVLRLISPALSLEEGVEASMSFSEFLALSASGDVPLEAPAAVPPAAPSPAGKALSMSHYLDLPEDGWNPNTMLLDLIVRVRKTIAARARVQLENAVHGVPTLGTFWHSYTAVLPTTLHASEVEEGGKILMPTSALEEITQFDDIAPPIFHLHHPGQKTAAR
jgi:hypothetical protein